jgi:2-polyprenyl-3-methyl-5-hydroxy-6-metoxy-1,4-benzoquinol methylase
MPNKELKTYQKLSTIFYDLELENQETSKLALKFYLDYALNANGPILEPMCGTGRFLIPMLQANLEIEGFDASEHMLNALIDKYKYISNKKAPIQKLFVQDFKSEKKYNLIFVPFGSWGLITDIEQSKLCLKNMYNHLNINGKLVLEIETINSVPSTCGTECFGAHTLNDNSKITINTITSYNAQTQIFKSLCNYKLIKNNIVTETEEELFEQYLYKNNELDEYLKESGFNNIQKFIDFKKSPAKDNNSAIIIYECTR